MADGFARIVVAGRWGVVCGWIVLAIAMAVALPSLHETQTDALGQLVPADSRALEAEQLSADLFRFPLASRTAIVERDPAGLPAARVAATAALIDDVNRRRLPGVRADGAYGVTNVGIVPPFARERGTAVVSSLLFATGSQNRRVRASRDFIRAIGAPAGEYVGITGVIPARAEQADLIGEGLPTVELVTVVVIALIVALALRSLAAPIVTLVTVAVAYLVSVRIVAVAGESVGVSVPPEVEPIMVALLFGVVTDYALFYMSRFRSRLQEGEAPLEAARETTAELTPLILACGVAVAAGSAALVVADLGFLRAFGPGMALAVLVGLFVTLTFLPAVLAIAGRAMLWPGAAVRPARHAVRTGWLDRLIVIAVRAPRRTTLACLALLAVMASGLAFAKVGNPLIRGLPRDSEPRVAYEQLSRAFAPGTISPATLVVIGPGIALDRERLAAFQAVLSSQPGVAGVVGPATSPARQPFGVVISPDGNAVRYVVVADVDPLSADAVRLQANLDARIGDLLDAVGLQGARALFAGDTAITGELIQTAGDDLFVVVPLVLLVVAIVLAVYLRALVAPVYLVAIAALAPLASLGLAVVFFQGLLGQDEITYFVPLAAGVLLVALGSDYNIFLVGRIWSEAERLPLREAIVAAAGGASHAISAAGLVLSASFAALAFVPVSAFQQLAFVLAVGLLIDAFLVRSILTPAVIALVGERSSWPGDRLASPQRTHLPTPGGPSRRSDGAAGERPAAVAASTRAPTPSGAADR